MALINNRVVLSEGGGTKKSRTSSNSRQARAVKDPNAKVYKPAPVIAPVAGAVAGALGARASGATPTVAPVAGAVTGALGATGGARAVPTSGGSGGSRGGSGGGAAAAPSQPAAPAVTQADLDKSAYAQALAAQEAARQGRPDYSYQADRSREDAYRALYDQTMATLEKAKQGRPSYAASYDDQIADLYAQISGRGKFSYDLNKDALWQQYKDEYTQGAKAAMRDTMGQAADLTGGYGSSYGQAVGQQAYDRRMEDLMAIAPELYDRAYGRWQDEGAQLMQQMGLAQELADTEYSRYLDEDKRWLTERDFAGEQADRAYERWLTERGYADQREAQAYDRYMDQYNQWLTERGYADAKAEEAYSRQSDNLNRLQSLLALGYQPTAQEIAEAGLNDRQYQALAAQYAPKASGGSGSGSRSRSTETEAGAASGFGSGADQKTVDRIAYEVGTSSNPDAALQRWVTSEISGQLSEEQYNKIMKAYYHAGGKR